MSAIKISKQLKLDFSLVADATAVFGRRGSGKSNTAGVIVEQCLKAGHQVVVLDPKNEWWGLQSSRNGQRKGHSIPVIGGPDGNLPLGENDGKAIAELLVQRRLPAVLCVQALPSKKAMQRFVTAFAEQLLVLKSDKKNRSPLLVVLEEARLFAPQRVAADQAKMLGAVQEIIRIGRSYGLGCLMVDQRPASVNKDLLTQIELLICHQVTGPHDKKALKEWIADNDSDDHGPEFLASLAGLGKGEAWFWSPARKLFQQTQVDLRKSFDAAATPDVDASYEPPRVLANVDIEKLKQVLGETVEKARENDPRELKKRIAQLEKEAIMLKRVSAPPDQDVIDQAVEKAVAENEKRWKKEFSSVRDSHRAAVDLLDQVRDLVTERKGTFADFVLLEDLEKESAGRKKRKSSGRPNWAPRNGRKTERAETSDEPTELRGGELKVMKCVAQYPEGASRKQITVNTAYKRSSRDTFINRLAAKGFVETDRGGSVTPTEEGIAALGSDYEPLPSGQELREYWLDQLSGGEHRVFQYLIEIYPRTATREEISDATDYKRSSRDTFINRLKNRNVIEIGSGFVGASEELFEG